MKHEQLSLFTGAPAPAEPRAMPDGFRYAPDVIHVAEEARLVAALAGLPFKEFEFHGFLGKRRVVSFGHRYDCHCANAPLPLSGSPRTVCSTRWLPNISTAFPLAGIATGRITAT